MQGLFWVVMYVECALCTMHVGTPLPVSLSALTSLLPELSSSSSGNLLKERGRTDEAIEQYKWALRINPAHADGWNNLASSYKDIGKVDDAIAAYRKALRHRLCLGVSFDCSVFCTYVHY